MKYSFLRTRGNGLIYCRICFSIYADGDEETHCDKHQELAKGIIPLEVRNFLKDVGWAAAHHDGGAERIKNKLEEEKSIEIGKISVLYAWWNRALQAGIKLKEFDKYMDAYLELIEAKTAKDEVATDKAYEKVKPWERYGG